MAAARIVRSPSPTFYYLSLFLAFPDIATNGQSDTEMTQVVTGPANGDSRNLQHVILLCRACVASFVAI